MVAKAQQLTLTRSPFLLLNSDWSGASKSFPWVTIMLFGGLCAFLAWAVAPRPAHLAVEAPVPVSSIELLGQRFPSVASQLTSSGALERSDEEVAGHLVAGFRTAQGERAPMALSELESSPSRKPSTLLPVEKLAWEAAARLADLSAKAKGDPESRSFSVFFPASYDGPFVAVLGSQRVLLKAVGSKPALGVLQEGRVEYAGAYEEVDSLHVPGVDKSEEFLLLRSAAAPVVFEYEVVETEGVSGIEVREGAVRFMPVAPDVGSPFHSLGPRAFEIAKPWVVDAKGKRPESAALWEIVRSRPGEVAGAKLRLRVNAAGLAYPLLVDPSFTAVGSMTSTRQTHTATLLGNGKVLITGGAANGVVTNRTELFDPSSGTFAGLFPNTLTSPRSDHTATLLPSGKVLITGGYTGSAYTNTAELFGPASGTFTATSHTMTSARSFHTATLLGNGKVLITGGYTGSAYLNTAELFDPASGTFTATSNTMTSARVAHTATLLASGQVLITGGYTGSVTTNTAELFDPASGNFTSLSPSTMASARSDHTATLLPSGKVLLAGGQTTSGITNTAELYDPTSGNFTSLSPNTMTSARDTHTATLLPSGKVLIAGGYTGSVTTNTAELFDPALGTFTATSTTMTLARYYHTATLLPSGQVLMTGGYTGSATTNTAELFDPSSGTFTSLSPNTMTSAREGHTATLLPSGKVLITGGTTGSGQVTNTAELFDPASGTFTSLSPNTMTSGRSFHTATLLPNGKVLLAGGDTGSGNTAELYDPSSGTFTATSSTMTSARTFHTATLLPSGKVLIAGGTNTAELFDPASGTFTATSSTMTSARSEHTATLLPSGKVLITGGSTGGTYTNTAELYDPTSGNFTSLSPNTMTSARVAHKATMLPSGKVLITGGLNASGLTNTAELFDPAAGSFTATSNTMTSARDYHRATMLPSGQVLITGGVTGSGVTNTAELFDPASGTFTATSNTMTSARYFHTATLLGNGKVLIGGGYTGSAYTNTAELFDAGLGFSDARRPVLSTATYPLGQPVSLVVTGTGFRGDSEASGSSFNNSATNYPILQLMRVDNEQTFFPLSNSATNWSDTAFSSETLGAATSLPSGYYRVTIFTNAIPSLQKIISIGPVSAVSRMTHGSAGPFDINLPLTGTRGVECRSSASLGPGNYTMVFTFTNNLTSVASATVTSHDPMSGTGMVSSTVVGPNASLGLTANQCAVNLTNVSTGQYVTVTLNGVADAAGNSGNVLSPQMGVLVGDVNGDGFVLSGDYTTVRKNSGNNVNQNTFRYDINADGFILSGDYTTVRKLSGTQLPSPP